MDCLWTSIVSGPRSSGASPEDESQARLAAIVDSSDEAPVAKRLDGVITAWNRGAERMFGWTVAEAVRRHITMIIPPDRLTEEDHVLARIRAGEVVDHLETTRMRKRATCFPSPSRCLRSGIFGAGSPEPRGRPRHRGTVRVRPRVLAWPPHARKARRP